MARMKLQTFEQRRIGQTHIYVNLLRLRFRNTPKAGTDFTQVQNYAPTLSMTPQDPERESWE